MSKATIISGGTAGYYVIQRDVDMDAVDAEISSLETRITELDTVISDYEDAVDDAEQEYEDDQSDLGVIIAQYKSGFKTVAEVQEVVLRTIQSKTAYDAAAHQLALAKLTQEALRKRKTYLENNSPDETNQNAWCADYTEDLTGVVGIIEPNGDSRLPAIIQPGWDSNATYNGTRDGILNPVMGQSGLGTFVHFALFPSWQKWLPLHRIGTITAKSGHVCDIELDSAISVKGLDVNQTSTLSDVSINYMDCNGNAFAVDDKVVVKFTGQDWGSPEVIGFEDNPKECPDAAGCVLITCISYYNEQDYCIVWDMATQTYAEIPAAAGGFVSFPCEYPDSDVSAYLALLTEDTSRLYPYEHEIIQQNQTDIPYTEICNHTYGSYQEDDVLICTYGAGSELWVTWDRLISSGDNPTGISSIAATGYEVDGSAAGNNTKNNLYCEVVADESYLSALSELVVRAAEYKWQNEESYVIKHFEDYFGIHNMPSCPYNYQRRDVCSPGEMQFISFRNPALVRTLSVDHGLTSGQYIRFGGISQAPWNSLNSKSIRIQRYDNRYFYLLDVDTTSWPYYHTSLNPDAWIYTYPPLEFSRELSLQNEYGGDVYTRMTQEYVDEIPIEIRSLRDFDEAIMDAWVGHCGSDIPPVEATETIDKYEYNRTYEFRSPIGLLTTGLSTEFLLESEKDYYKEDYLTSASSDTYMTDDHCFVAYTQGAFNDIAIFQLYFIDLLRYTFDQDHETESNPIFTSRHSFVAASFDATDGDNANPCDFSKNTDLGDSIRDLVDTFYSGNSYSDQEELAHYRFETTLYKEE